MSAPTANLEHPYKEGFRSYILALMSGNDGDEADNSKAKAGPSGRSKGSKGPKRLYPEEDNSSSQDSVRSSYPPVEREFNCSQE